MSTKRFTMRFRRAIALFMAALLANVSILSCTIPAVAVMRSDDDEFIVVQENAAAEWDGNDLTLTLDSAELWQAAYKALHEGSEVDPDTASTLYDAKGTNGKAFVASQEPIYELELSDNILEEIGEDAMLRVFVQPAEKAAKDSLGTSEESDDDDETSVEQTSLNQDESDVDPVIEATVAEEPVSMGDVVESDVLLSDADIEDTDDPVEEPESEIAVISTEDEETGDYDNDLESTVTIMDTDDSNSEADEVDEADKAGTPVVIEEQTDDDNDIYMMIVDSFAQGPDDDAEELSSGISYDTDEVEYEDAAAESDDTDGEEDDQVEAESDLSNHGTGSNETLEEYTEVVSVSEEVTDKIQDTADESVESGIADDKPETGSDSDADEQYDEPVISEDAPEQEAVIENTTDVLVDDIETTDSSTVADDSASDDTSNVFGGNETIKAEENEAAFRVHSVSDIATASNAPADGTANDVIKFRESQEFTANEDYMDVDYEERRPYTLTGHEALYFMVGNRMEENMRVSLYIDDTKVFKNKKIRTNYKEESDDSSFGEGLDGIIRSRLFAVDLDNLAAKFEAESADGSRAVVYTVRKALFREKSDDESDDHQLETKVENLKLKLKTIEEGSSEYEAAGQALNENNIVYDGFALFDLSFRKDGKEYEPVDPGQILNVMITPADIPSQVAPEQIGLQHLIDSGDGESYDVESVAGITSFFEEMPEPYSGEEADAMEQDASMAETGIYSEEADGTVDLVDDAMEFNFSTDSFSLFAATYLTDSEEEDPDDQLVNNAVTILFAADENDTVLSGMSHKVTMWASYSNPNDEDNAILRVYFRQYDNEEEEISKDTLDAPENFTIDNLIDGYLPVEMEGNMDLSVQGEYNQEECYLEFELTPGSSVKTDVIMTLGNGLTDREGIVLIPEIINADAIDGEIETGDPVIRYWEGGFEWSALDKKVNGLDTVNISVGNEATQNYSALSTDLTYTFYVQHDSPLAGNIWTDHIEVSDVLTLPEGLKEYLNGSWTAETGDDGKFTGAIYSAASGAADAEAAEADPVKVYEIKYDDQPLNYTNDEGEDVESAAPDMDITEISLDPEAGTITAKITLTNSNRNGSVLTADMIRDDVSRLSVVLYGSNIEIISGYTVTGEELIANEVTMDFSPYKGEPIELTDSANAGLSQEVRDLSVTKTRQGTVQTLRYYKATTPTSNYYSNLIPFKIDVNNASRFDITDTLFDILPDKAFIDEASVQDLQREGYAVKHADVYYRNETTSAGSMDGSTWNATYSGLSAPAAAAPAEAVFRYIINNASKVSGTISGTVTVLGTDAGGNEVTMTGSFESVIPNATGKSVRVSLSGTAPSVITGVRLQVDNSALSATPQPGASVSYAGGNIRILGEIVDADPSIEAVVSDASGNPYVGEKTMSLNFSSDNWWDASEDYNIWVSTDNAVNNIGDHVRISFDLETSISNLSNVYFIAPVMVDEWVWKQTQLGSLSFTTSSGTLAPGTRRVTKEGDVYKAHIDIYLNDEEANALKNSETIRGFGLQIVGSGSSSKGSLTVKNLKLVSDSAKAPNYIEREITVPAKSSYSLTYQIGSASFEGKSGCLNTVYVGNAPAFAQATAQVNYIGTTRSELHNVFNLSISKQIESRYAGSSGTFYTRDDSVYLHDDPYSQANLTTLGRGDVINYTVTLRNDGDEDQYITLEDWNPLVGNYNYWQGGFQGAPYTAMKAKGENWKIPALRMYGLDDSTKGYGTSDAYLRGPSGWAPHDDFVTYKNPNVSEWYQIGMTSSSSSTSPNLIFLKIPAGTEAKQTFVLNLRELTDYEYYNFEAAVRQAATNFPYLYSDTTPSQTGPGSYDPKHYMPANTISISGRARQGQGGLGATVTHSMPARYSLTHFNAGADIYKTFNSYFDETTFGVYANYATKDVSSVYNRDDQYMVYGITLFNDSSEGLDPSNTELYVQLPTGVEFVDMLNMSPYGFVRDQYKHFEYDSVEVNGRNYTNVNPLLWRAPTAGHLNWSQQVDPYQAHVLKGGDQWFSDTFLKATDFPFVLRGPGKNDPRTGKVTFTFEGGPSGGHEGARMPAYSSVTFYYLCRIDSTRTSGITTLRNEAHWVFKGPRAATSSIPAAHGWTGSESEAKNDTLYLAPDNGYYNMKPGFQYYYSAASASNGENIGNIGNTEYRSYSSNPELVSTVTQNLLQADTFANITKSVIGRNSLEQVTLTNREGDAVSDTDVLGAQANYYRYNMNKYSLKENEVITFMIAVANDDTAGGTREYIVEDQLPVGLTFLGVNHITKYSTTSTNTGGRQQYYLSRLISTDGSSVYMSAGEEGKSNNEGAYNIVSWDSATVPASNGPIKADGYYTFNYDGTIGQTQAGKLTFNVYQPQDSVTYIIYSCKVDPRMISGSEFSNTAVLKPASGMNLALFDDMRTAPYYSSDLLGNTKIGQPYSGYLNSDRGKTLEADGTIKATVKMVAAPAADSASISKSAQFNYDRTKATKNTASAGNPEIYKENGHTNQKAYDATPLFNNVKVHYGGIEQVYPPLAYMLLDGGTEPSPYFGIGYSLVDGIHPLSKYRSDVVWGVTVKNDSMPNSTAAAKQAGGETSAIAGGPIDASRLLEKIDQPNELYGYSLILFNEYDAYIGHFTVDYGDTGFREKTAVWDASYTSKVTGETVKRNIYDIDLIQDYLSVKKGADTGDFDTANTGIVGGGYGFGNAYDALGMKASGNGSAGGLDLSYLLNYLPAGWYYDVYFYTDLTEDKLDWYYNTTSLVLYDPEKASQAAKPDVSSFRTTQKDATEQNGLYVIRNDDWVTAIGTDGIYHVNRTITEDGVTEDGNSKNEIIWIDKSSNAPEESGSDGEDTEDGDQLLWYGNSFAAFPDEEDHVETPVLRAPAPVTGATNSFTMEMISNLYQTDRYQDAELNDIIMYALLPGASGGLNTEEPGGGFTLNTSSYNAYILKGDGSGEKIPVSAEHYKVMYSLEALHGGRHPSEVSTVDDTVYNVDFDTAKTESIWFEEGADDAPEIKDIRSFRVVFDNTIVLTGGDRLFFDFSVNTREDAVDGVEYHTVFGYIYDLYNAGTDEHYRLYEDTTDVTSIETKTNSLIVNKKDSKGDIIAFSPEDSISYIIYMDNEGKFPLAFTSDAGKVNTFYYDGPAGSDEEAEITSYPGTSGATYLNNLPVGVYYVKETKAPNGYELNENLIEAKLGLYPSFMVFDKDSGGKDLIYGDNSSISFRVYKDAGGTELVYFTKQKGGENTFIYSGTEPNGTNGVLTATGKATLKYMPEGTYYIRETSVNGVGSESYLAANRPTLTRYTTQVYYYAYGANPRNSLSYGSDSWIKFKVYSDYSLTKPVYFNAYSGKNDTFTYAGNEAGDGLTDEIVSYPYLNSSRRTYFENMPSSGTFYVKQIEVPAYETNLIKITSETAALPFVDVEDESDGSPTKLTIIKKDGSGEVIDDLVTGFVVPVGDDAATKNSEPYMEFVKVKDDEESGAVYRIAVTENVETAEEESGEIQETEDTVTEIFTYKGKITIENVSDYGRLYFWETTAPGNYILVTGKPYAYVGYPTVRDPELVVTNTRTAKNVVITKVDSTNTEQLLGPVSYQIYDSAEGGNLLKVIKRDDVTYNWPTASGSTVDPTEYSIPRYAIVDDDYEGAVDTITTDNGLVYIELKSDATCYVEETDAPSGYTRREGRTAIPGTGSKNSQNVYEVSIQNASNSGDFRLEKRILVEDGKDAALTSPDFSFTLKDESGAFVPVAFSETTEEDGNIYIYGNTTVVATGGDYTEPVVTTSNGYLKIKGLPAGTYTLTEEAMEGYESFEAEITVDYTESKTYTYQVINRPGVGDAVFTKVRTIYDVDGEPADTEVIDQLVTVFNVLDADAEPLLMKEYNGRYRPDEEGSADISTIEGILTIENLPTGTYILHEVTPPEGYVAGEDIEFTVTAENHYEPHSEEVINNHTSGNVRIRKINTYGAVLDTDQVAFVIKDTEGNTLKFVSSGDEDGYGHSYTYDKDGVLEEVTTGGGKLYLKDLPLGDYVLEETAAPVGYSKSDEKLEFTVDDVHYSYPLELSFRNPDTIFGPSQFASASYKKIEETDNPDNLGYGYYGKESDYAEDQYNYIVVDDRADLVTYTLNVGNISENSFEHLVLIDRMPEPGDTGVVNLKETRNSEFTVKLAEAPEFEIYLVDNANGTEKLLDASRYSIEFSDRISFTEAHFNGKTSIADRISGTWYKNQKDSTKSFRIVFANDFILKPLEAVRVKFKGEIQDDAEPGMIAWNDFGYRYYVGESSVTDEGLPLRNMLRSASDSADNALKGTKLTPEPPKVGVMIPTEPELTKLMDDVEDGTYSFEFEIYEADEAGNLGTLVKTVTVKNGETVKLLPRRTINGETNDGYLDPGKTYVVKEQKSEYAALAKVEGIGGKSMTVDTDDVFVFTYDAAEETEMTFTNEVVKTNIEVEKVWDDADDQDGKRPASITIRLLADGVEADAVTVTAADVDAEGKWHAAFTDLPKYEKEKEIKYTIKEDAVGEYSTTITGSAADGFTVTNAYTPGLTSVTVNKVWEDETDKDKLRPGSITVELYADGTAYGGENRTVVLSAANDWMYIWEKLPMMADGKKIEYTVKETVVPEGYTAAITGDATKGYIITNTHTSETPDKPSRSKGGGGGSNHWPGFTPETNPRTETPSEDSGVLGAARDIGKAALGVAGEVLGASRTGDPMALGLLAFLAIGSAGGICVVGSKLSRKKEDE